MTSILWSGIADAVDMWAGLREEQGEGSFNEFRLENPALVPTIDLVSGTGVELRRWLTVMHLDRTPEPLLDTVVRGMTAVAELPLRISSADVGRLQSLLGPSLPLPPVPNGDASQWTEAVQWGQDVRAVGRFVLPPPKRYGLAAVLAFVSAWLRERILAGAVSPAEALEIVSCFSPEGRVGAGSGLGTSLCLEAASRRGSTLGVVWRQLARSIARAGDAGEAEAMHSLFRQALGEVTSAEAGRALVEVVGAWHGSGSEESRVGSPAAWAHLLLRLADYEPGHSSFEPDGAVIVSVIQLLRNGLALGGMSRGAVDDACRNLSRRWSRRQLLEERVRLERQLREMARKNGGAPGAAQRK